MKMRPFQVRVFECIMAGKNVLLQAPTGSGKTRAALAPFLQNMAARGDMLPLTCRYAVPMRVLANQFFHENQSLAEKIDAEARTATSLVKTFKDLGKSAVAIQTGEQPDDPQFEAMLTFCTIDQLLASFLAIPYGVGNNRANINVGAVISSYLILDEFHLYPLSQDDKSVEGARTTTIQMLRLLKGVTPFVLMTATFSSTLLKELASLLNAEIVTVTDDELAEIAQGRTRTFQRSQLPMDAQTILAEHQQRTHNKCTLIVCNTVWRAQNLFLQLRHAEAQGTRVVLLHSRFSTEDRRQLAKEVEQALGPAQWDKDGNYSGPDIIVIATQVVEVGLNISVAVLHTENAPASSLVQRAGRCARFDQQQGRVIVYPLPIDEKGKEVTTLPYDKKICAATWEALKQFDGEIVGFKEEQVLIDAVHTAEDEELLKRYKMHEGTILDHIFESLCVNERGVAPLLIRDVTQVQVLIHDDPDAAITKEPWQWQSFSMNPYSLMKKQRWQAWQEKGLDWVCKHAVSLLKQEEQTLPDGADGIDNRQQEHYKWECITNPALIPQALMIALPSQLASYDKRLGFVLLDDFLQYTPAEQYQSSLLPKGKNANKYSGSRQSSYQEHIGGLVRAYNQAIRQEIAYISHKLESQMQLPQGMVDHAVRLAIACHDLGKLDRQWQQWAFAWQTLLWQRQRRGVYQLPSPDFCFAKTNYDYSPEQRAWQREVTPKRPHHACESVAIARPLIATSLGISKGDTRYTWVLRAICGAIARHHSSQAREYGTVLLEARVKKAAEEAIRSAHQGAAWSYDPSKLLLHIPKGDNLDPMVGQGKLTKPHPDRAVETWLYFIVVHALRLADQRAERV